MKISIRVRVAVHGPARWAPVEPEVSEADRCGLLEKRIDDVDEAQILTNPLDDVGGPWAAEFQTLHFLRPNRLEEPVQSGPIHVRGSERGGRLEYDRFSIQSLGHD